MIYPAEPRQSSLLHWEGGHLDFNEQWEDPDRALERLTINALWGLVWAVEHPSKPSRRRCDGRLQKVGKSPSTMWTKDAPLSTTFSGNLRASTGPKHALGRTWSGMRAIVQNADLLCMCLRKNALLESMAID